MRGNFEVITINNRELFPPLNHNASIKIHPLLSLCDVCVCIWDEPK